MTHQEFETNDAALMTEINRLNKVAKERVEEFVEDILGNEFEVQHFCPDGFRVCLMKDGKSVFGCDFDVYMRDDFHYDENRKFVRTSKFEANIGTCGSFEVGVDDTQEKKYMAFGRFLSMSRECCLDKELIKFHEAVVAIRKQRDELEEEYQNQ